MSHVYSYTSPLHLYRSRAHRDLPSFPTRRSSDLARDIRRVADVNDERDVVREILGERLAQGGQLELAVAGDRDESDRKSTRLNSSHVRSSYAVFCLKKKTENK